MMSSLLSVGLVLLVSQPAAAENVLPNASFEEATGENPAHWTRHTWGGSVRFEYARGGHGGERSVLLTSDQGADASWFTIVPVEPRARYRLSGWIKTDDLKPSNGRGAVLNIHNIPPAATAALTGTNDWTEVEVTFDTNDEDAVQVNCTLGAWGLATGRAWFDDLKLEQVGPSNLPQPRVTIHAAQERAPLSQYIYGQFIEHLGRCIYGGIWAEMLEDRKFFYAIGAPESPWRTVGPAASVEMIRDGAFVGEHSPRISLTGSEPRGITHGGLRLLAGDEYVGRIWLAGTPDAGPVRISLIWGDDPTARQTVILYGVTESFTKSPLRFKAGNRTDEGRLEIVAAGRGNFRIGAVSLMPANNVQGLRADTLELLKQLDAPVYRWPGGNFVSGYNWKDALGDPDHRPPRKNPAWRGIEHNDFGIDEFMTFCRLVGAEPYVTVNSGLGDTPLAVDEVEYANGAPDTPMGKLRAQHGHPEPYRVRFWSIGNEMYGDWQLGHMPLERYIQKHNQFAEGMRAVDPTITLVAVGAVGPWSEGMLRNSADHMDLISEHFYCGEKPGLNGHMRQIPDNVRRIAEAHRKYRRDFDTLSGKDIRIALDEWNYWYGRDVFGEIGTRYYLKDALGIAAGLHEYARQSDMYFMANYAQTVNVIGAIKTSPTTAAFETTGLVLKLYRRHFGQIPVKTEATPLLDAQAAWTRDRKTLTVGLVNPSRKEVEIALEIRDARLTGRGTRWQIAGPDPQAYNDPDQPPQVVIEESPVSGLSEKVTVAPCSVTLLALRTE